ncbi:MAG: serine hydrolase domain-containing protein [Pirellula sp.]
MVISPFRSPAMSHPILLLLIALGIHSQWPAGALAQEEGSDRDPVTRIDSSQKSLLDEAADYSAKFSGRAVLVMHRGELVYERYDKNWIASRPHMLASGTKSFSGVIAMMAVQDGLLSLDELACETLTEWKEDPRKSKITIRHLLTLSSGLHPADAAFPNRRQNGINPNPVIQQRQERIARQDSNERLNELATGNWFKDSIQVPTKHEAGSTFEYGPSHFYAFGELLNRKLASSDGASAKSFEQYARTRLFEPLGMQIGVWTKDQAGNVNIPGGMFLTAREWAKFGQFILDKGCVTKQDGSKLKLIDNDLLSQCFVPSANNPSYGLTWWLNGNSDEADTGVPQNASASNLSDRIRSRALNEEASVDMELQGKQVRVWMAAGLGKQRLIVLPDQDLVIVRFAEASVDGRRFKNAPFLKPILSAFPAN